MQGMLRRNRLLRRNKTAEGVDMANKIQEFLSERARTMAEQAKGLRQDPLAAARKAGSRTAVKPQSLHDPIRAFARSGVKLTTISQETAQRLIELQAELVTAALADAAAQLEKATRTVSVADMIRGQGEVLKGARERILADMSRAVQILREAGGDVRKVASATMTRAGKPAPARKRPAAKRKRAARKAR